MKVAFTRSHLGYFILDTKGGTFTPCSLGEFLNEEVVSCYKDWFCKDLNIARLGHYLFYNDKAYYLPEGYRMEGGSDATLDVIRGDGSEEVLLSIELGTDNVTSFVVSESCTFPEFFRKNII